MTKSIINKMLCKEYYTLSKEERKDVKNTILKINIYRQKVTYFILLVVNIILLFFDIFAFSKIDEAVKGYKNLFYLRILIIASLSIFIVILYFINEKTMKKNFIKYYIFSYASSSYILTWCAFLGINAQFIHGQISSYIIGAFCLASFLLLNHIQAIIIFLFNHTVFVIGVLTLSIDIRNVSGNIVNSTFLIVLALIISNVGFSSFINDYRNEKRIKDMNQKLMESYNTLEGIVEEKTLKLDRTQNKLVNEIIKRNEVEIHALRSKAAFENEKRSLNEKIEYEKLKTQSFTNISHDLKTPINVIFSSQQMIALYLKNGVIIDDTGKLYKYVSLIKQNCYRLIRLIQNLVDISRIDVGSYSVQLKNYNIVSIVKGITFSVDEYIKNKEINLKFNTAMEEKTIACDPEKIERIILNLLSNAIKYTPSKGSVLINIYEERDYVCISVKDTGIGIPIELQDLIFERFFQVNRSVSIKNEGSGIGLSLVKSLVEIHGGDIILKSKSGEGSEFIIYLPDRVVESINEGESGTSIPLEQNVDRISIEFSDIYGLSEEQ